jgi:hypothetical protein
MADCARPRSGDIVVVECGDSQAGDMIDQGETSGCAGCGRCITWYRVGSDITEEIQTIPRTEKILA